MIQHLETDCETVFRDLEDDGFGYRTPACRECTHPRADRHSRIYAAILERTFIGPVLQVHIFQFLALMVLKFRFRPRQRQIGPFG